MSALKSAWKDFHNPRYFLGAFLSAVLFAGPAWAQAPALSAISPTSLTSGAQVTLTGAGFGDTQQRGFVALWNSHSVPVISWSDSQIVVTVPAGTTSGLAFVNQNGAWSNGVAFTVAGSAAGLGSTPLNFGNVSLGASSTLPEVLTNTGNSSIRIFWAWATSPGVSLSGLTTPLDLEPGQSFTFDVTFTPSAAGPLSGGLRIFSNSGSGPFSIPLSGEGQGATAGTSLTINPTTLNFGSVTVGTSGAQTASITATGGTVVVSSVSGTTSAFTLTGLSLPLTLQAGQSASFSVGFTPQASGTVSTQLTFVSDATGSSAIETLSGSGSEVAATPHTASLSWAPSESSVAGYNIYRGNQSGGPYTKLNSSLEVATTFLDNGVAGGQTYYYVVTAASTDGMESDHSNEVKAVVPSP